MVTFSPGWLHASCKRRRSHHTRHVARSEARTPDRALRGFAVLADRALSGLGFASAQALPPRRRSREAPALLRRRGRELGPQLPLGLQCLELGPIVRERSRLAGLAGVDGGCGRSRPAAG